MLSLWKEHMNVLKHWTQVKLCFKKKQRYVKINVNVYDALRGLLLR